MRALGSAAAASSGAPAAALPAAQTAGVELVMDLDDPRLALYRSRSRRDHDLYIDRGCLLAAEALFEAGLADEAERRRLQTHPRRRGELRQLPCVVAVHYTWDCLRQLVAAREAGRRIFVGSVLLPTSTPQDLVELARGISRATYAVDRGEFEAEFGQDVGDEARPGHALARPGGVPRAQRPGRSWRRYEGGAAQSTVRYAVVFPLSTPLVRMRPPFLVLDGLTSATNIGQILRTAYHLGVVSVVVSRASWSSLHGRACRVSMGWLYWMDCHLAASLVDALDELRLRGIRVFAAENQFSRPVGHDPPQDRNWALIVGHEGLGISAEAVAASDACVCVPQEQGDCLNVSHAAAICLYELSKKHIKPRGTAGP